MLPVEFQKFNAAVLPAGAAFWELGFNAVLME
jgi:hypothetical protein